MGLFSAPDIPAPTEPRDFTRGERDRLSGIVTGGDPMRDNRDRQMIDRLLTNNAGDVVGPTASTTLAMRNEQNAQTGRQISEYMSESDRLEQERVLQAEERLGQLEGERQRDLDEYDQLVQSHKAQQEVMDSNFKSGLLRAGVNLAGTALDFYAPGAGTALKTVGNEAIGDDTPAVNYSNNMERGETYSNREPSVTNMNPEYVPGMGLPGDNGFGSGFENSQNNFNPALPDNYDPLGGSQPLFNY